MTPRRLIVCADDFGLNLAVNEAVERAHRDGILTTASLMVGEAAAADAVARARRLPGLHVGLHLVVVDGRPVLPRQDIPDLVDSEGAFRKGLFGAGLRFFFRPRARQQLARELAAQFAAFRATGLALDHVNAHCHMHLHPTVGAMAVALARTYGAPAVRVPAEPLAVLRRAGAEPASCAVAAFHAPFAALLRRRVRRAGLVANDRLLGLAWTGGLTEPRLLRLLDALPQGVSEVYCHPALAHPVPHDGHRDEFDALVSPAVRQRVADGAIALIGYRELG